MRLIGGNLQFTTTGDLRMHQFRLLFLVTTLALCAGVAAAQPVDRLFRFPATDGSRIVFTYAGDLYTVSVNGGTARKLTNDVGFEMFAKFSPDGKTLAFTGQYDGNTEVYTMPAEGGSPKRLTFTATLDRDDVSDRMGPNNIVMGWRDNQTILYRSRRIEPNDFKGQLFFATINGGIPEQVPLPRGGFGTFSPDGNKLVYNRVFREFRTWKRYRGGQADDIWVYDFKENKHYRLAGDSLAQDILPMWGKNDKVYFISDRDKRMNLFVVDPATRVEKKLSNFTDYDIKFPSIGGSYIVFENGGYIYKLDYTNESAQPERVNIVVSDDLDSGRGGLIDVSKSVTNYEISRDGARALFGSRGDVFTVPAKDGRTRNITATPGVHERNAKWSPDGKWIAYISDASGEDELYVVAQDGLSAPRQLTKNADTYKYDIVWSPDSKYLLWADKKLRLQYVDVATGAVTEVAKAEAWEFNQYVWSPDAKWIAYAKPEVATMGTVQLYSLETKQTIAVTDGWFGSYSPSFGSDGKYLFFVSNRTFNPIYSQTEWNHAYRDMAKIYLVTLAKETASPFAPKSDEVKPEEEKKDGDKSKDSKEKPKNDDKKVSVKVDADGIQSRIAVLPISASNYWNLQSVGNKLYYMRNGSKDEKPQLLMFDFEKKKETELGSIGGYEISADGKKMLVGQEGSYAIIDLPSSKIELKEKLDLSDLKVKLDRKAEWKQIFNESWRQMKYFFFADNLHGVDWDRMKATYEQLVPYVNHRADLTYIIGEMIGELNIGHSYVGGGDYPKPQRIKLGLLGAKLERDKATGYYRIVSILKGQNWEKDVRSPLTDIGVDAKEGDYIIAVDGKPTNTMTDIYESLVNTAGKQVKLKVNAKPEEKGARETTVIPTDDEQPMYYYSWVQKNIEHVNKKTNGRVGYVHIPDMGVPGLNEFVKYYYPQLRKEALIVDVRGNGGGNVSPMIIERLARKPVMFDMARNTASGTDPGGLVLGPKVMVMDEFSASDGDIVNYRFKKMGLGKLVGKRTWGGVVGIRGTLPLLDGGFLNRPEFANYDLDAKAWPMEGHGVDPDIYVDNDPLNEYKGVDDQLDTAIKVILDEMAQYEKQGKPLRIPPPPKFPDKH